MSDKNEYSNIYQLIEAARKSVPVDLNSLAEKLGIEVKKVAMEDRISGHLTICADGEKPKIEINASHGKTRRRFTCAHEIGHWVLHRALIGDGVTDNKAYRATPDLVNNTRITQFEETEANKFAAYLLMPEDAIRHMVEQNMTRDEIAEKLLVSRSALNIKMDSMGL